MIGWLDTRFFFFFLLFWLTFSLKLVIVISGLIGIEEMANRSLSRKEMEEMKKRQDEEAAAEVLHQVGKILVWFVNSIVIVGVSKICRRISRRFKQSQQSLGQSWNLRCRSKKWVVCQVWKFSCLILHFYLFSEEDTKEKGKLYKPTSKLAALAETFSTKPKKEVKDVKESKESKTPKRTEKRKSNLELFKEELRA
jgi:hypothetical protein